MKPYLILILASLLPFLSSSAQQLEIISYNIRYNNPHDGINSWENRKEGVTQLLSFYQPVIFGLQEATHQQLVFVDSAMPNYQFVGVGRDDGKEKGEYSPIFFDSTIFELESSATFWLSEKSEKVSVGWDAAMERICTYALLSHKLTQKRVWVFNTHFDHIGKIAREKSAELILAKISNLNPEQLPVILMGDFNAKPEDKPIEVITSQLADGAWVALKPLYGPPGTFNGFNPEMKLDSRIDYLFVSNLIVQAYAHIDDRRADGHFLSDHLPVWMQFLLKP